MGQPNQGAKLKDGAKLITANRLRDGAVVFLTADGWSAVVREALVLDATTLPQALERAVADMQAQLVVEAYAIEAQEGSTLKPQVQPQVQPLRLREQIRAAGPTVRPDLNRSLL
jgi:hypothetical protein